MNDAPLDPQNILDDIDAILAHMERGVSQLQSNIVFLHADGVRAWPKGRAKAVADRLVPIAGALDALADQQDELVEVANRAESAFAELMEK